MTHSLRYHYLFICLCAFFVFVSCSSSENTVVIEDAPTSSGKVDTTPQHQANGSFTQLTIGENQQIRTLDPLFVENASGMRVLQLVFEGLVRYNSSGEIIPAIAKDWTMTDNETTYRFILKSNLYYHDSNAFANGRGRRLVANDVKRVFERMAKADVPGRAAQIFMNIEGFEPYYQEQHQILNPADRQLSGVSGISIPNDSTVVFSLTKPDELFLQKLAYPPAVIYPQESLTSSEFHAVGTGPFRLSQTRSDSLYIFSQFDNYHVAGQPRLARIDVQTRSDEIALLNAMNRGEIQLIPELGPQQVQRSVNANGQLNNTLTSNYTLYNNKGESTYFLRYNPGADISKNEVSNALSTIQSDDFFSQLPQGAYQILWALPEVRSGATPESLSSVFSSDPVVHLFYRELSSQLSDNEIRFSMSSARVANRNIPLQVESYLPVFDAQMTTTSALATIIFQSMAIARNDVRNLSFNNLSWWMDLREVTLPSSETR